MARTETARQKAKKAESAKPHKPTASKGYAVAPSQMKKKKPHRFRPGTVALREIRRYQKSTELLLRKSPFERLVREVALIYSEKEDGMRFQGAAVTALQEITEASMIGILADALRLAIHAKRITVQGKDVEFAADLRYGQPLSSDLENVKAVLAGN